MSIVLGRPQVLPWQFESHRDHLISEFHEQLSANLMRALPEPLQRLNPTFQAQTQGCWVRLNNWITYND
jgi:hypothetical protein